MDTTNRTPTVCVLGIGLQGRAVLHDLVSRPGIGRVVAADLDEGRIRDALSHESGDRVDTAALDASDGEAVSRLFASYRPDVVICMLPPALGPRVARASVHAGAHYVSTSYTGELAALDRDASDSGVAVLPEMGLDPGIDLVLAQLAISELDEVHGLEVFGGGLPEPACADASPLRYKVTWTFEGVLAAYMRPAHLLRSGEEVHVDPAEIFHPDQVGSEEVPELGRLEVYPNGDALAFIEPFGLGEALRDMGRYTLRWPGHCALWYPLVQLGLLDDGPRDARTSLTPRQMLARHLEPRLRFARDERDVIVLRARARGIAGGRAREVLLDVLDYRDLTTGLFAMNRTVGYTAAIGARMLLSGTIPARGVLSPARDVPPVALIDELAARGIQVVRR